MSKQWIYTGQKKVGNQDFTAKVQGETTRNEMAWSNAPIVSQSAALASPDFFGAEVWAYAEDISENVGVYPGSD